MTQEIEKGLLDEDLYYEDIEKLKAKQETFEEVLELMLEVFHEEIFDD